MLVLVVVLVLVLDLVRLPPEDEDENEDEEESCRVWVLRRHMQCLLFPGPAQGMMWVGLGGYTFDL